MQIFSVCVSGCPGSLAWKNQSRLQVHATALQWCKCVTSISQLWLFTCACLDAPVCLLFVCFVLVFFFQNLLICPCQLRSPDQIQNKIKFKLITLTNTHTHARIYTHVHSSNSFALMRKVLLMSWYTSHMLEQQQDTLEVLLRGWIKHPLNSTL